MKKYFLWILLALNAGCTIFLKKPEVKFSKAEIVEFKEDVINMNVELEVNNPNSRDIQIDGIRYAFRINDSSPFKQELGPGYNLPAGKKEKVVIPLSVPTSNLVGAVYDIFANKPLKYVVVGSIKVNGSEFPFTKQGELPKLIR